jgi:hypothetical protein
VESRRALAGQLRGICLCVAGLIAAIAPALAPVNASAAPPVLEFVSPASAFPIAFTADGGPVTAAMTDFDTVVHCSGSDGAGEITGPRSTVSSYAFTGCETQGGSKGGQPCMSAGANPEEIKSGTVEADLVFIDQARREVGMVLNPHGGVYLSFECGGESVKALGSFLSPVGPINREATSFTATLSRSGAIQIPNEYESLSGEKLQAIPTGEREGQPAAATGVELGFAIHTSAPLEITAVTAAEIEARQRAVEVAAATAAKRRQEEEAAAALQRQKEEAAMAAAKKGQEEAAAKTQRARDRARSKRARRLAKALKQCRRLDSHHRRTRCEARAKRKYRARFKR